jgi:hypothetical protein
VPRQQGSAVVVAVSGGGGSGGAPTTPTFNGCGGGSGVGVDRWRHQRLSLLLAVVKAVLTWQRMYSRDD